MGLRASDKRYRIVAKLIIIFVKGIKLLSGGKTKIDTVIPCSAVILVLIRPSPDAPIK